MIHLQGDNPILDAWVTTLRRALDDRFSTTFHGPEDMSQEVRESYTGAAIVAEAVAAHPGCAAIVSNVSLDDADASSLPRDMPPVFALEWPFPDAAIGLLRKDIVRAGIFEFHPALYPGVNPDPDLFVGEKHLFLDKKVIQSFGRAR